MSVDDLNRVGAKFIAPLFDPKQAKVALITDPTKIADTAEGFKK